MKYVKIFEAFETDKELYKTNSAFESMEIWLKTLDVTYNKVSNFSGFQIHSKFSKQWGIVYENGSWFLQWPGYGTIKFRTKKMKFSELKKIFEEYLEIEKYLVNIVDFTKIILEDKPFAINSVAVRFTVAGMYVDIFINSLFSLLVIPNKEKLLKETFRVWWPTSSGDVLKYIDPSKGECLLLILDIFKNKEVANFDKIKNFVEKNEKLPVEKIVEDLRHELRGRTAAKKFLG